MSYPMLVMEFEGDRPVLKVLCQLCLNPIIRASDGAAIWFRLDGVVTRLEFMHRLCCQTHQRNNKHIKFTVEDFDAMLVYLVDTLGVDLDPNRRECQCK